MFSKVLTKFHAIALGVQDLRNDEVINQAMAIVEEVVDRILEVNSPQAIGNLEPQPTASNLPEIIITTSQELIPTIQGQIGNVEALRQDGEIVEEELELQPQAKYESGVDRDSLSQKEQELYDLITQTRELETSGVDNKYVIRQTQYNTVSDIIKNNSNSDLERIKQLIDNDTTILYKHTHKNLAAKIMSFNGDVVQDAQIGRQQGIGLNQKGPKDITIVASLEKLREIYGILDGDKALELAKKIVISVIKANIPEINNDVAEISRFHSNTSVTNDYKQAAKTYIDSQSSRPEESDQQKTVRLRRKNDALDVIHQEIRSSLTAVNNNIAAYRALDRAEKISNQELFTEAILGRYNDREMLAYAIMANLDVREIQDNLQQGGVRLTASNIWTRQQENIQGLIKQLGNAQRAYNMDHEIGVIDVGGIDPPIEHIFGPRRLHDSASCPHGYCVRIVDSMQHHSQVNLSEASPGNLSSEFQNAVKKKVNLLSTEKKNDIKNWNDSLRDDKVNITVNNEGSVIFSTKVNNSQVDLPCYYKTILTDVAAEIDSRYNFTNPNHKLQLVKKQSAVDVFENANYINFDH